jgi:serine/threonine protein kinase
MSIRLNIGQAIRSQNDNWYKCVQHLGTGGNAVAYLMLSTSGINKGSLFALKIFQRVTDADRLAKFHGEIAFLEGCSHPAIMKVYDSGVFVSDQQSHPFVVMEYLPTTLYSEARRGGLDITAKLSLATQLLSGLGFLDSLNPKIIHRDIKPQNIFIKGKSCVLGDFGLMKVCKDDPADDEPDRQEVSAYIGMPFYYRTPDLIAYTKKESELTTSSDVFQLGLVLAELFSGRNPCRVPKSELDPVELDNVSNIPGELGFRIQRTLSKMLQIDPSNRETVVNLLDHWTGIFNTAVEKAHALNGRAL